MVSKLLPKNKPNSLHILEDYYLKVNTKRVYVLTWYGTYSNQVGGGEGGA